MKKSILIKAILTIILSIVLITAIFNFFYFKSFKNKVGPITETEKQRAIEILNKSMNIEGYEIRFSNKYLSKHGELVQVELIKENSRKYYPIDLRSGRILGK